MRKSLVILAVSLCLLQPYVIYAGECYDMERALAALEKGPGSHEFWYSVYCFSSNPIVEGRLWAGPNAAATFAALRADTLQSRLTKALSALLVTSWADSSEHRRRLYRIAARRGVSKLDSVDVFMELFGRGQPLEFTVYEDMAILRDCRAVAILQRRYLELRVHPEWGYDEEILDVLSCLYHIPCPEAVGSAKWLYSREADPTLRTRLQLVMNRKVTG